MVHSIVVGFSTLRTSEIEYVLVQMSLDGFDAANYGRVGRPRSLRPLPRAQRAHVSRPSPSPRRRRAAAGAGCVRSILTRNCHAFADELIFRLTGNHAPEWLNRAARVGTEIGLRERKRARSASCPEVDVQPRPRPSRQLRKNAAAAERSWDAANISVLIWSFTKI